MDRNRQQEEKQADEQVVDEERDSDVPEGTSIREDEDLTGIVMVGEAARDFVRIEFRSTTDESEYENQYLAQSTSRMKKRAYSSKEKKSDPESGVFNKKEKPQSV